MLPTLHNLMKTRALNNMTCITSNLNVMVTVRCAVEDILSFVIKPFRIRTEATLQCTVAGLGFLVNEDPAPCNGTCHDGNLTNLKQIFIL